jgi:hypothetical protein
MSFFISCSRKHPQTASDLTLENKPSKCYTFGVRTVCVLSSTIGGGLVGGFALPLSALGLGFSLMYMADDTTEKFEMKALTIVGAGLSVNLGIILGLLPGAVVGNSMADRILNKTHSD